MRRGILKWSLIGLLGLCLMGCGSNTDESKTTSNDNKGSRENPYKVGETIEIENAYVPDYFNKDAANIPYKIELVITDIIEKEEGIAFMERNYNIFTFIPSAEVTFSVQGDYSDAINFSSFMDIRSVTDEMEIKGASVTDEKWEELYKFYTNVTYEKYITVQYDQNDTEPDTYKYITIEYYSDVKCLDRETVYVLLEDTQKQDDNEAVDEDGNQQEESVEDSAEEIQYQSALAAEGKLQYTYAKRLYAELNGYKDSQQKMEDMISILSKYNGTYYGESLKFDNINVYMYVQDGTVRFKYDSADAEISPSVYEIYGAELDESLHEDTVIVGNERRSDYSNPSENYIWIPQEDGSVMIAAWTENSIGNTWNGVYSKVSDSVEME